MGKLIRNGIEYGGGNGTDIFKVTQAEYDALVQAGTLVHNALYVISDAPNLNPTASDIEYSSGVSVKQAIDSKADSSDIPTVSDFIKTDTTGSVTTDSSGFTSVTRTGNRIILSAWSPQTDIIIIPFTATGSGASGYYRWWFKVCGADLTPKANYNLTIYFSYVEL